MKRKFTLIGILTFVSVFVFSQNKLFLEHEANSKDEAECPADAIFSQPAILPYGYLASSEEYNVEAFSYFTGVAENIGGIRFWGELIDFETFTQYDPPENFVIRFYDGNIDEIGDLLATFELLIDGTLLEVTGFYNVWTFDADFPTTIDLSTGWVSIQNTDEIFSFWWRDTQAAPDGKGMYVNHNNGVFYTWLWPFGFCLTEGDELPTNDLSILNILSPESGVNLTITETVSATITNYGTASQSNIELNLLLNGVAVATETYSETINYLEAVEYTFSQTIDLSEYGDYEIEVCTNLPGDENTENDCYTKTVTNIVPALCEPGYLMGCDQGDGFNDFALSNLINNGTGCEDNTGLGWSQYFELDTAYLEQGETYELIISSNNDAQYVSVWIDFDDNLILTEDEMVIHNFIMETSGIQYSPSIDIPSDAQIGTHVLRARTQAYFEVNTPCGIFSSGETEDYMVNVVLPVDMDEILFGEINIYPNPAKNLVKIENVNAINIISNVKIYDVLGNLVDNTQLKNATIGIEHLHSGIYFLQMETNKKIIVKKLVVE